MAFTLEEVDRVLLSPNNAFYVNKGFNLKESSNYKIIADYLTGKTTSLQGLQNDVTLYYFTNIAQLLKSIDPATVNDQLILDLIHEPVLSSMLQFQHWYWLLSRAFNNDNASSFSAVLKQFRRYKSTDDQIAEFFLTANINLENFKFKDGPLKTFLLTYVKQHKTFNVSSGLHSYATQSWSYLYFILLEEVDIESAKACMLQAISSRQHASFFIPRKDGAYVPAIVAFIESGPDILIELLQSKFIAAIQLNEKDNGQFNNLLAATAMRYLDFIIKKKVILRWEEGTHIQLSTEKEISYTRLSGCAFHFLLLYRKEKVITILNEWLDAKLAIPPDALKIIQHHMASAALPFLKRSAALPVNSIENVRAIIDLLAKSYPASEYNDLIWNLSSSKSKPVREFVARIIAEKDAGAETKAIQLLENKSADTRQTAAIILSLLSTSTAADAIMKSLHKETNDNARDILLQTIAESLPASSSIDFVNEVIQAADKRGKLNKPVEPWLDETTLPKLYYTDGSILPDISTRFLLYRMSRVKSMRSDIEARYIIHLLDKEKSAPFASAIIKLFIDKQGKPEHKYLMALAALLGNDSIVDKIRATTNQWIDQSRYKMAEYGVGALALQGSDKALRWVEWYSRKYKSKKANVGVAAMAALEAAAEELNITTHELRDRIVPDFGFDGLFKHFTVDGDEYRGFIDCNFTIAFFNEDNKKLKSIPAAADASVKDEFKAIAKEVRDITKSQCSRLEYYLIIQRRWAYPQWQQFFLQNPVMFIYATRILWGVFNSRDELVQTFICNEDTSLLNVENEEVEPEENFYIGIAHPSQLDKELLQQWKKQFFNLSVESIFPQLDRRTPDMKDIDLSRAIITKFNDKGTKQGAIRSTLERYGWHKGPVGDGGMLDSFNLLYFEKKIEAILEVSGVGAGYGWGGEEKLGRFFIIDKTKDKGRWFTYPKSDDDAHLVKLKNVPSIFLNEALAAIEAIK